MFLSLACYLVFKCITGISQITGDFRTNDSGSWTNIDLWDYYDGTEWTSAENFPGEVEDIHNTVSVLTDHEVIIDCSGGNITLYFDKLIVYGHLMFDNKNTSNNIYMPDTDILHIDAGTITWASNSLHLVLPENAILTILNVECNGEDGIQGANNTRRLIIGNVEYAASSGGGNVAYLFSELNCSGGSLYTYLETNANDLCEGDSITLTFETGGLDYDVAEYFITIEGEGDFYFDTVFYSSYTEISDETITFTCAGEYIVRFSGTKIMPDEITIFTTTDSIII